MPLTELCLQVKLLSLGPIKQFLSKASPLIRIQFCMRDFKLKFSNPRVGSSSHITFFEFFQALEPPREESMTSAVSLLYEVRFGVSFKTESARFDLSLWQRHWKAKL